MKNLAHELRVSVEVTLVLVVLCCGLYPVVVWAVAQALLPDKANGSLIKADRAAVGSSLIGQGFAGPAYFHPRPSATGQGYDATGSGGTNLGPTSRRLIEAVAARVAAYRAENELSADAEVPADAVTCSSSGLDPHISPKNAMLQAGRVAKARGVSREEILRMVTAHTEGRDLGILGEPRVNVLMLNLDLDGTL